jgi:hypothetical protein
MNGCPVNTSRLRARSKTTSQFSESIHPAWLRCSSIKQLIIRPPPAGFTFEDLALKPSGFCSVRVNSAQILNATVEPDRAFEQLF